MKEISRNKLQELTMIVIYDALTFIDKGIDFDIKQIIEGIVELPFDECPFFVKEASVKALTNQNEIIELLTPYLRKWKFSRLAKIEQAILLLSVSHFRYVGDVSKAVVINIAITLAKRYLNKDDYKFVNAILDKAL